MHPCGAGAASGARPDRRRGLDADCSQRGRGSKAATPSAANGGAVAGTGLSGTCRADQGQYWYSLRGQARGAPAHSQRSGAPGRNRTRDLRFTKPLLYQLSYKGIFEILAVRCTHENPSHFTRFREGRPPAGGGSGGGLPSGGAGAAGNAAGSSPSAAKRSTVPARSVGS